MAGKNMSKFDFIKKIFKNKDEEKNISEQNNSENNTEEETSIDKVILTHEETLYSIENTKKSKKPIKKEIQPVSEEITWRDIEGI
jgi:hypothetical protein